MAAPDVGGVSGFIMAISGLIVGAGGLALSRRGQRDDKVQAAAAHALAGRVQASHEMEALIDRLERALERADRELVATRVENDRRSSEQSARCRAALSQALDHVQTLHSLVQSSIADSAALLAEEGITEHRATDHPDEPLEG